jgi:hypothetical protein
MKDSDRRYTVERSVVSVRPRIGTIVAVSLFGCCGCCCLENNK